MDLERLKKVVEEVVQQCRFGRLAWQGLRSALNGMDNEKAFFYVHTLLTHAGTVARLLWSEQGSSRDTGNELRQLLKVADDSALAGANLKFLVAADEGHFARWLDSQDHYRYLPMNVMPQGTMSEFQQDVFLRSLDPELYQFSWYDRNIDVLSIAESLRRLESAAENWRKRQ